MATQPRTLLYIQKMANGEVIAVDKTIQIKDSTPQLVYNENKEPVSISEIKE